MALDKALKRDLKVLATPRPAKPQAGPYGRAPVYRIAHACFDCRKSFKLEVGPSAPEHQDRACPGCGEALHWMGRSFRAPRRDDLGQWKKVEHLWREGFRFHSYRSCPDAERLPETLSEVADFVRRNPDHPFRVRS